VSTGPGRVMRAIKTAFDRSPSATFTVADLARIVYPDAKRIERKHRVAIIRALNTGSRSGTSFPGWASKKAYSSRTMIYYNRNNKRSREMMEARRRERLTRKRNEGRWERLPVSNQRGSSLALPLAIVRLKKWIAERERREGGPLVSWSLLRSTYLASLNNE
jgi:hypothetical protein